MTTARKQIAFDLDTKVCHEIIGEGYPNLYSRISRFMSQNGFEHVQGSVYVSRERMTNAQVANLVYLLLEDMPYLEKCVRDIRQSDVMKTHSLNSYFAYDGTPGEFAKEASGDEVRAEGDSLVAEEAIGGYVPRM